MSNPNAASDMRNLPTRERERLIVLGVLAGQVIDARARFVEAQRRAMRSGKG